MSDEKEVYVTASVYLAQSDYVRLCETIRKNIPHWTLEDALRVALVNGIADFIKRHAPTKSDA